MLLMIFSDPYLSYITGKEGFEGGLCKHLGNSLLAMEADGVPCDSVGQGKCDYHHVLHMDALLNILHFRSSLVV